MTSRAEQRTLTAIAAARVSRVPVDHNGRPIGEAKTYTYDENGRLVTSTDAATSPEGADQP